MRESLPRAPEVRLRRGDVHHRQRRAAGGARVPAMRKRDDVGAVLHAQRVAGASPGAAAPAGLRNARVRIEHGQPVAPARPGAAAAPARAARRSARRCRAGAAARARRARRSARCRPPPPGWRAATPWCAPTRSYSASSNPSRARARRLRSGSPLAARTAARELRQRRAVDQVHRERQRDAERDGQQRDGMAPAGGGATRARAGASQRREHAAQPAAVHGRRQRCRRRQPHARGRRSVAPRLRMRHQHAAPRRRAHLRGQQLEHARGGGGVEVAGRLVGQHDARAVHERARDRHALQLAARQRARHARAPGRPGPTAASTARTRAASGGRSSSIGSADVVVPRSGAAARGRPGTRSPDSLAAQCAMARSSSVVEPAPSSARCRASAGRGRRCSSAASTCRRPIRRGWRPTRRDPRPGRRPRTRASRRTTWRGRAGAARQWSIALCAARVA